jgi:DNA-binding Lrp family transcriptional regulator
MSKTEKLLNALQKGAHLTSRQISSRFGLKNPTAAISNLRKEGYSIRLDVNKSMKTFYKMNRPTNSSTETTSRPANGRG